MSKMHLSTVDAFKHIHTQDCVTLDDEQLKYITDAVLEFMS